MSNHYRNPIAGNTTTGPWSPTSLDRDYGTNFSVYNIGGYMEVDSLEDLNYTVNGTGNIFDSGNTIPVKYYESPNVLTDKIFLWNDGISSGRRRLGMLVYVLETDQVYQYVIPNYESLFTAATSAGVVIGDRDTDTYLELRNKIGVTPNAAGQALMDAWLDSSIEGVSGVTRNNARWRVFWGTDWQVTGGTVDYNSTGDLRLNSNSGDTVTISGLTTITGGTYLSGTSTLELYNNLGDTVSVTGFTGGGSGSSGSSGTSGSSGSSGESGSSGSSGTSGSSGSSGTSGSSGSSGESGSSGSSGTSGSSGSSGESGSSGSSGTSGSSGSSGESGSSGSSGTSGSSGSSGESGSSGSSGTSGSSGSSGTSGIGGETVGGEGVRITGSGTTSTPYTADTIYNTNLTSSLEMDADVGGIEAGTTVADLTGKTMVDLFNDLLFPTVLPTYTTPSITTSGINSQTLEVGTTESINFTGVATKNDAGEFTSIRLRKNSSDVVTDNSPTEGSTTDIPDQFGFTNNNNPNHTYTSTAFSETLTVPTPTGSNTSSSTTYDAEGDCDAGVVKKDNKGNDDTRSFGTNSNTPQAARTNLDASNRTITGVYPYWYGTSSTQPTISSIQDAISGGTANKSSITNNQNSTLTITFNASSEFLWFAHFEEYNTKQSYFVSDLNKGNFGSSGLFNTFTTGSADSPDGYWNGVGYKIYIGNYQTETQSFGSMQLRTSTV